MKKVDSRRNAPYVIASGACTAWQSINTQKADSREAYFASAKFMDRHADKSARDDREGRARLASERESNNSKHAQRRQDFEARIGALQGERGDKAGSPIAQASRSNPRF